MPRRQLEEALDDNDSISARSARPSSRFARPPSYISDINADTQLPTTPSRAYNRESSRTRAQSPAPTYLSYGASSNASPDRGAARQDVRSSRPISRRLSDVQTPNLTPTAQRMHSSSPNRLLGARALPMAPVNRSTSPDTSIRMPLMPEKTGWVDEIKYSEVSRASSIKAFSIASYDGDDAKSIAPSVTDTLDSLDIENSHYGPAPAQPQARRNAAQKTTEVVKLTDGNLVLDCAIPEKLRSLLSRHDSREFTHLKYTACTCDPDEFAKEGFTLRQVGLGRETELLITLTMYNEDEQLFTRTLHGVIKNIAHLCSRTKSRTWGPQGWKKVVVCIVADGRRNVHPRVLDVLAAIGVYQEGLAQNKVDGRPVTAHIYEYTSQYSITSDLQFRGSEKGIPPIQLLFCLKEQNAKKLNSHRWMFNGFAPLLMPNICVLLDVGTRPGSDSIYSLWKTFDLNSNVAGAAGEIKILKGKGWSALLNPLVASQNFEYKMSNILDKPFQSVLGYIAVLPGAFSAYRYVALAPDDFGRGPLDSYFKGEKVDLEADVFEKNMYLAEDRILCWELVARRDRKWLLKYVSEAWGETDCPDTVAELIGQRRRWLNGATFAATFALYNFKQIWYTSHSKTRKVFLHIEFAYQSVELLLTFFGLANFYLTFFFITQSFGLEYHWASYVAVILRYLCIMVTAGQFILALGNRPKGAKALFMSSLVVYAVIMAYTLFCALFLGIKSIYTSIELGASIFSDRQFANVVASGVATTGVYFISSILYLEPWHCFTSFGQYMILLPFYLCTLTIFAFCNIHDLSWGTKEEDIQTTDLGDAVKSGNSDKVKVEIMSAPDVDGAYENALTNIRIRKPVEEKAPDLSKAQEDYFKEVRTRVVLVWLVCNLTLMMSISEYYGGGKDSNAYLSVIMYTVVIMTAIRFAGSIVYLCIHVVQSIGVRKSASSQVVAGVEAVKQKSKRLMFWRKHLPTSNN